MVQNQMGPDSSKERDMAIDLEIGGNAAINEDDDESRDPISKNLLVKAWNGFASCESDANSVENGEALIEKKCVEQKVGGEKPKKKACKKPPKPPRPPRAPSVSLDAADQKLIREINELAMLKRARVERMKALKRMKNAKSTSSNGNLVPLVITLIFCVVILWQGVFSRGSPSLRFHGSPESSMGARGGFISVQFYNASAGCDSSSASPNNFIAAMSNGYQGSTMEKEAERQDEQRKDVEELLGSIRSRKC